MALSGSPKLTVLPWRSAIDLISCGAIDFDRLRSEASDQGRAFGPFRIVFDADNERVERDDGEIRHIRPHHFGDTRRRRRTDDSASGRAFVVEHVGEIFRHAACGEVGGVGKDRKRLQGWDCGAALAPGGWDCGAGFSAIAVFAGARSGDLWPAVPRHAPCHSTRFAVLKDRVLITHHAWRRPPRPLHPAPKRKESACEAIAAHTRSPSRPASPRAFQLVTTHNSGARPFVSVLHRGRNLPTKCDLIKADTLTLAGRAPERDSQKRSLLGCVPSSVKRRVELRIGDRPQRRSVEIDERGAHRRERVKRLQCRAIKGQLGDMRCRRRVPGAAPNLKSTIDTASSRHEQAVEAAAVGQVRSARPSAARRPATLRRESRARTAPPVRSAP